MSTDQLTRTRVLTKRQMQVLFLVADGKSYRDIAVLLSVCEKTVRWHTLQIRVNLSAATNANAVNIAWEQGILPNGG